MACPLYSRGESGVKWPILASMSSYGKVYLWVDNNACMMLIFEGTWGLYFPVHHTTTQLFILLNQMCAGMKLIIGLTGNVKASSNLDAK